MLQHMRQTWSAFTSAMWGGRPVRKRPLWSRSCYCRLPKLLQQRCPVAQLTIVLCGLQWMSLKAHERRMKKRHAVVTQTLVCAVLVGHASACRPFFQRCEDGDVRPISVVKCT